MNIQTILSISTIGSSFLCACICLRIAVYLWKPRKSAYLPCFIGAPIISVTAYVSSLLQNEPLAYLITLVVTLLILLSCFHISILSAVMASIFSVFHTMCLKGILTGLVSLLLKQNMYQILSTETLSMWLLLAVTLCKIFIILKYRRSIKDEKMKIFFHSGQELQSICYQHVALFLFMLFYSYNFYYNLDLVWFSFAQSLTSALMLLIYYLILSYGIKASNLIQIDIRNQHLTQQMKSRLANHHSYQSIYGKIRSFEHQFNELSISALYLLNKGDLTPLSDLIKTDCPRLLAMLPQSKQFSNEISCDAILFEWNSICIAETISFDGKLFIPEDITLDISQLHRILQLLWDVNFPLMQESSSGKASLSLSSKISYNWLTIQSKCSFLGMIGIQKDMPYFQVRHWADIKSAYLHLHDYVTAQNSLISFSIDAENHVFAISVSMYYHSS